MFRFASAALVTPEAAYTPILSSADLPCSIQVSRPEKRGRRDAVAVIVSEVAVQVVAVERDDEEPVRLRVRIAGRADRRTEREAATLDFRCSRDIVEAVTGREVEEVVTAWAVVTTNRDDLARLEEDGPADTESEEVVVDAPPATT